MSKQSTPTRFGALVRVSTEQQEKTGESLRTQRADNEQSVERLEGLIVGWYGGQEHATPGFEKKEVNRLLDDAKKGIFDAVIVAHADRWSRDNEKSQSGLDPLKSHGIRFFVGTTEYSLYNPEHSMFLGLSAVIGRFQAHQQKLKSIQNRIHRARRGLPTCDKLPFGRTFDPKTEKWGIDEEKRAMIEDIAKRYLAGERMPDLGDEYGLNHANLHKVLTKRSGTKWEQTFDCDDLNVHEVVEIEIPPLLPEKTIAAIRHQAQANKTYQHGQPKYQYLLGGMVFCEHCGYAMFGQTNHQTERYYRHAHTKRVRTCNHPKSWVKAEELEQNVVRQLFECFGNPVAVQQAVEAATPNLDKIIDYRNRQQRIEESLKKLAAGRDRILRLIVKGTITDAQAESELTDLANREAKSRAELDQLQATLAHIPTPAEVRAIAGKVSARFVAQKRWANHAFEDMSWEDRRALAQMVFSGTLTDGRRMGVYIEWADEKEGRRSRPWRYAIRGHLIHEDCQLPMSQSRLEAYFTFGSAQGQDDLTDLVAGSASRLPSKSCYPKPLPFVLRGES